MSSSVLPWHHKGHGASPIESPKVLRNRENIRMNLEAIIGLEVHVHLNTKSKLFCKCANVSEADQPNQFVCPVCMGFPGTLPVLNAQAVEWTILAGLALGCEVAEHSTFARKSYFYPDLPKGYQISQYEEPLCFDGTVHVYVGDTDRVVRIERVHLEEDAAKNIHTKDATLIDHNRAGTPLIEIVTAPDLRSPEEAKAFLEELQRTMRYLGISNADMEHGDLRVDANISLRKPGAGGQTELSPKTEVKNLNSFRAVERALAFEVDRQSKLWEAGTPPSEAGTRGWDDGKQVTVEQRGKEGEADYRYFPDPDIPPLAITKPVVEKLRLALPELPHAKEERFRRQYRMAPDQAHLLVGDRALAAYAEQVFSELAEWNRHRSDVTAADAPQLVKLATNYLLGDFRSMLVEKRVPAGETKISSEDFAELMVMLHRAEVNRNAVPEALREMERTGGDASTIVSKQGLSQVSDDEELRRLVQDVITANPAEVDKVRAGKLPVLQFLVGKVMAETKGRANPKKVQELFKQALNI